MNDDQQYRLLRGLSAVFNPGPVTLTVPDPGKPTFIKIEGRANIGLEIPASAADTITVDNLLAMVEAHRKMGKRESFHVIPPPEGTGPTVTIPSDQTIPLARLRYL